MASGQWMGSSAWSLIHVVACAVGKYTEILTNIYRGVGVKAVFYST
jgi:hypothetical protein